MSVVAVVGLGYVGLPLVVEFGKLGPTIGFDIVEDKVARCAAGTDPSREIPDADMALSNFRQFHENRKVKLREQLRKLLDVDGGR